MRSLLPHPIWKDALGAWLIADDPAGGAIWPDLSVHARHATIASPSWAAHRGRASVDAALAGPTYATATVPLSLPLSVSFWVAPWASGTYHYALDTDTNRTLCYATNATLAWYVGGTNCGSTTFANPTRWQHVGITATSAQQKWYLDGVVIKTTTASPSIAAQDYTVYLGCHNTLAEQWNGPIADYILWNRVLSEQEMGMVYSQAGIGYRDVIRPAVSLHASTYGSITAPVSSGPTGAQSSRRTGSLRWLRSAG